MSQLQSITGSGKEKLQFGTILGSPSLSLPKYQHSYYGNVRHLIPRARHYMKQYLAYEQSEEDGYKYTVGTVTPPESHVYQSDDYTELNVRNTADVEGFPIVIYYK